MAGIDAIRSHYNCETDDESLFLKRVLRPLSFYLTWFYMKVGVRNADWVNLIGLVNGLGALALMFFGFTKLGVLAYLLYMMNDQCDGNLARATGTTSYHGKWMDGAIDVLVDGLLPVAVFQNIWGGGLSLWFMYSFFLLNRFSFFAAWADQTPRRQHYNPVSDPVVLFTRNLEIDTRVLCLLVSAFLWENVLAVWAYIFSGWLVILCVTLIRESKRFKIHKRSRMGVE